MNPQLQSELLKRIDALAAKLGVAADQLWRILVAQGSIERTMVIVWTVATFAATLGMAWLIYWAADNLSRGHYNEEEPYIAVIFCAALVGIVCIVAFFINASQISGVINPEYWALQRILGSLK